MEKFDGKYRFCMKAKHRLDFNHFSNGNAKHFRFKVLEKNKSISINRFVNRILIM